VLAIDGPCLDSGIPTSRLLLWADRQIRLPPHAELVLFPTFGAASSASCQNRARGSRRQARSSAAPLPLRDQGRTSPDDARATDRAQSRIRQALQRRLVDEHPVERRQRAGASFRSARASGMPLPCVPLVVAGESLERLPGRLSHDGSLVGGFVECPDVELLQVPVVAAWSPRPRSPQGYAHRAGAEAASGLPEQERASCPTLARPARRVPPPDHRAMRGAPPVQR
jgi:hypothetical protein